MKEEDGGENENKVEDLATTEELPSLPPVGSGDDNAEVHQFEDLASIVVVTIILFI